MSSQLRKWHRKGWPKQPIILSDWLLGMKTARYVGMAICKGDHSEWWQGGLWYHSQTDKMMVHSLCPYESVAACSPCHSSSHVEYRCAFLWYYNERVQSFISCPGGYLLIHYIFTALLWCFILCVFLFLFCSYVCCYRICHCSWQKTFAYQLCGQPALPYTAAGGWVR